MVDNAGVKFIVEVVFAGIVPFFGCLRVLPKRPKFQTTFRGLLL